jgi:NADPH-dependent curcumin reductase CurA
VLGVTGLTAYFGLLDIGRPEPGQTVVVSGAAGATGSVVVQLAKIHGCRVVGIAGRPDKCAWVRELGAEVAIDYRAEDVGPALMAACPDGIDVYYDNVGGPILQQALLRMRRFGRIVCCGAISQYDTADPAPGPRGVPQLLVTQRLRMQGFIVTDFAPRFDDGRRALAQWLAAGELQVREDRLEGLERAPAGLIGLLAGENVGKRWVAVATAEDA